MSTPGRAPLRAFARRHAPRCALAVPVRVTVMRSGTAYSLPGRSVDLCEGGIAVVLAGEVRVTDLVGVEFLLPDLGLGLQTKAVVRHYSALRCGFEFKDLTRHQQAVIREWARQRMQAKTVGTAPANPATAQTPRTKPVARHNLLDNLELRRFLWIALGVLALLGLFAWWHWQRGWREIEERVPQPSGRVTAGNQDYAALWTVPSAESSVRASNLQLE